MPPPPVPSHRKARTSTPCFWAYAPASILNWGAQTQCSMFKRPMKGRGFSCVVPLWIKQARTRKFGIPLSEQPRTKKWDVHESVGRNWQFPTFLRAIGTLISSSALLSPPGPPPTPPPPLPPRLLSTSSSLSLNSHIFTLTHIELTLADLQSLSLSLTPHTPTLTTCPDLLSHTPLTLTDFQPLSLAALTHT